MGEFKNIFKQLRLSMGITQTEMAKRLGVSRSTISMYEIGSREPDFEQLEAIADFFNLDTDYLIGRTTKTTVIPKNAAKNAGHYLDDDTAAIAREISDNADLKLLMDAARGVPADDLKNVHALLLSLKRNENG